MAMRVFLSKNVAAWRSPGPDEIDRTFRRVAAGTMDEDAFAGWLERHVTLPARDSESA